MVLPTRPRPAGDLVTRSDPPSAWIRLAGGVDLATAPALAGYTERLHGLVLRFIVVDLAAVTFVGSTFVNFLATLHEAHPESELVLRSPPTVARIVLAATGMDRCVVTSGHPVSPVGSDDAGLTIVQLNSGYARARTGGPLHRLHSHVRPEPPAPAR